MIFLQNKEIGKYSYKPLLNQFLQLDTFLKFDIGFIVDAYRLSFGCELL